MESSPGSGSGSPTGQASHLKHFKKAFIVEYERVESHNSGGPEDSNSSEFSSHSSAASSSSNSSDSTSFANAVPKSIDNNYFKRKLDLYKDEVSSSESDSKNAESKKKKSQKSSDSKTKSSKHAKKKTYCVCKSTDGKRFMIACDNCDEWFHGDCVGVTQSLSKRIKAYFCPQCRSEKKSLKIKYTSKYQELSKNLTREKAQQLASSQNDQSYFKFYSETQTRLKKETDLFKKIKKKQQEPNVAEPKCAEVKVEQKFYGKTNVTGEDIENFMSAINKLNSESNLPSSKNDHDYTAKQCDETASNCMQTDTGDEIQDETDNSETQSHKNASDTDTDHEDSDNSSKNKKLGKNARKSVKNKTKKIRPPTKIGKPSGSTSAGTCSRPRRSTEELVRDNKTSEEPGQCLGPECVTQAQVGSKYCSHECGMKLARRRLDAYLKDHYDQYSQTESLADKLNIEELERINSQINLMKKKLAELESKHLELDRIIDRAKYARINPMVEKEREKYMDSNETEIYCVTCGQQCSEKQALKHMEKCFNKIESQAFFASFYKSNLEGKAMFCDYYNPQTKMYCKRLKVMCPEHEKERKINDDEVCGYPLPKRDNLFQDCHEEICLAPKRTCSMHFKWDKLRRAVIDLDRLRTYLKLEELVEQKRMNENALSQRKDLFSILLHKTVVHDQSDLAPTRSSTTDITA